MEIKIYKTILFPDVLYGCETWSLTLRKERKLKVFQTRSPRRIFGLKRDDNGEYRKLHNELHNLSHSPNIVRAIKSRRSGWARYVARMEEAGSGL